MRKLVCCLLFLAMTTCLIAGPKSSSVSFMKKVSKYQSYQKSLEYFAQIMEMNQAEQDRRYADAMMISYRMYCDLQPIADKLEKEEVYFIICANIAKNADLIKLSSTAAYYGKIAEQLAKNIYKEYSKEHVNLVINVATYYVNGNDHTHAEEWLNYALELAKSNVAYKSQYLQILNLISLDKRSAGFLNEALEYSNQLLSLTTSPTDSWILNNIAICYDAGDKENAVKRCKQLVERLRIEKKTNLPTYETAVSNLATYLINEGNPTEALEIYSEILNSYNSRRMQNTPQYAQLLHQISIAYQNQGNIESAIDFEEKCVTRQQALGTDHAGQLPMWQQHLAYLYMQSGKYDEAAHQAFISSAPYRESLSHTMLLPTDTRVNIWNNMGTWYSQTLPSIVAQHPTDTLNMLIFDAALMYKGMLLNTERSIAEEMNEASPALKALYDKWQSSKKQLPDPSDIQKYQSQLKVIRNDEQEFMSAYRKESHQIANFDLDWNNVYNALPENAIAIEFVSFKDKSKNTDIYMAVTLRRDDKAPVTTIIGDAADLSMGTAIYQIIMSKLESRLSGIKEVYFSPMGKLYNIPIESLCSIDKRYKHLKMYRLSSTRELVLSQMQNRNIGQDIVVYGGLRYDMTESEMRADEARRFVLRSADNIVDNSYQDQLLMRQAYTGIDELPGTKIEAEAIASMIRELAKDNLQVTTYTDTKGTETSFKALSGKQKRIVHIGTHGFYLPASSSSEVTTGGEKPQLQSATYDEELVLRRSGLLMAGALQKYSGEKLPDDLDDGILTSQEIAMLDLRGLELITLSACETALGDVATEGVFGLQRGFKKAGAASILMSLWKVDDNATYLLMKEFYNNWLNLGMNKHDALEAAKTSIRTNKEQDWSDPKYWAAFILLDGIN